jgi:hypothetical protein
MLVAPSTLRAAGELGASIQALLYADEERTFAVRNRSTVTANFRFEAEGDWAVEPTMLTLEPDERGSVEVTRIGTDGASLAVRVQMAGPQTAGQQRGEILLTARLFARRPFDPTSLILPALLLVAIAVGLLLVYRSGVRLRIRNPVVLTRGSKDR